MPKQKLSPSELLVNVLEGLGESEAVDIVIIYNDEAGNVCWQSNTDSVSRRIGLMEFAKACILQRALG